MPKQTTSQTVGPYFSIGLIEGGENLLVRERTSGQRILIQGKVLDGDELPISDAMVEIWQADAQGIYNHPVDPRQEQADPHFHGFGRCASSDEGDYWFKTVKPGPVPGDDNGDQAPHVNVRVFARGMLIHATTRLYFSDESANQEDPLLNSVDAGRRQTLIAGLETSADLPTYRFDLHMQGDGETVFLDP
jgi:protocatechuate 3,4-dioxygenase alpha subunit